MRTRFIFTFIFFVLVPCQIFSNPIAVVMINEKTEKRLGAFPIKRSFYTKAIQRLFEYKARAVILKFFFVTIKDLKTDRGLSNVMKKIPVFLQAAIDRNGSTKSLPNRFSIHIPNHSHNQLPYFPRALLPHPLFTKFCYAIGYVNVFKPNFIPLAYKHQNTYFPSLWFSVMSLLFPGKTKIISGKFLEINGKKIPLSAHGEILVKFPKKDYLKYFSFEDLLDKKIPARFLKNKIVIIGYDGANIHSFPTPIGRINAHRMFYYYLQGLYNVIK